MGPSAQSKGMCLHVSKMLYSVVVLAIPFQFIRMEPFNSMFKFNIVNIIIYTTNLIFYMIW